MAFTYRDKRRGYDNIANGSAAGFEIHNTGATSHSETSRRSLEAGGNTSTSALAEARRENVVHGPTSNDNVRHPNCDSSGVAAVSGWTSGTSRTTVNYETVG